MKLLLLSGWSNSGKSTVSDILCERHKAKSFAFADELKKIVAEEADFPFEWTQTQEGKLKLLPNGKTVRQLLIQRGQEIRAEKNDPGFFARQVAKQITNFQSNDTLFVISDWRLGVELQTLKQELPSAVIHTIRIHREGQEISPVADSLTEHELDTFPFDFTLKNSGTNKDSLAVSITTMLFILSCSR